MDIGRPRLSLLPSRWSTAFFATFNSSTLNRGSSFYPASKTASALASARKGLNAANLRDRAATLIKRSR
jgi:hypothetical protein